MPPKKRKAAEAAAARDAEEEAKWQKGAKGKTAAELRAEKAAEKARQKEELRRLTEEDSRKTPGKPIVKNAGGKKQQKDSVPDLDAQIASFGATNIDDALDAMTLVNEKTDNASRGAAAGQIEKHPERRFKAAFEAFKERELPKVKIDYPGLRLQQYHDLLYKKFQKHPDNPFNQLHVSYDASKQEKLELLKAKRDAIEQRLAQ
ncbi:hypothetical protein MCUN1_000846 [Malassezia cuniculi]|uniref:Coiled-coil domain-containing protein n=1 Tax=Malassezia cuniculi TaxID=948313 RepID=A0AAF0J5A4_9BASI|nr:hypothetical protein MCUN1_000846 [Malassezia cuniculi]